MGKQCWGFGGDLGDKKHKIKYITWKFLSTKKWKQTKVKQRY